MRFRATRVIALIGVLILSSPTLALGEPGPPRDAPEQQDGSGLSINGDVVSSESDDYPVVDSNQAANNVPELTDGSESYIDSEPQTELAKPASPTLVKQVDLQHLASEVDGTEVYSFEAEVALPASPTSDQEAGINILSFIWSASEDLAIQAESPRIDDNAHANERVAVSHVSALIDSGTDQSDRAGIEENSHLLSFDLNNLTVGEVVRLSTTLRTTAELKSSERWELYDGKLSAFERKREVADTAEPRMFKGRTGGPDVPLQYWINTGENEPKIYRMVISNNFPAKETSFHVDREFSTDIAYGDIAITPDGKIIYGIEFKHRLSGLRQVFRLDSYDAETGKRLSRSIIRVPWAAESQLNSLSVDYDGNLLVSGPKRNAIYKIDVARCVREGETCDYKGNGVTELNMTFPGFVASGDFIVLPNGGLYGLGTKDGDFSSTRAHLIYWPPNVLNDPSKGRKSEGIVVGKLGGSAYGAGRIGDHIITVDGDGYGGGFRRNMGVHELSLDPDRNLVVRENLMVPGRITSEPQIQWPPATTWSRGAFWGATSLGESGPTPNERFIRVEKELPAGRITSASGDKIPHEFRLGANQSGEQNALQAPIVTSGPERGLQNETFRGIVRVGQSFDVFEEVVDATGKLLASPHVNDYGTTLRCVEGDSYRDNAPEIPTGELKTDNNRNARIANIIIPDTVSDTITCRFVNRTSSGLSIEKFPRADRQPATPVELDDQNRANLTYIIEVSNKSNQRLASGPVDEVVQLPRKVKAVGDVSIEAKYKNGEDVPESATTNYRNAISVEEFVAGARIRVADSVQLDAKDSMQFIVKVPIEVQRDASEQELQRFGKCTWDRNNVYQGGGIPNGVDMPDDSDGPNNNVACIPLKRAEAVGFQMFKVGLDEDGTPIPLSDAKFDLHENHNGKPGKKVGTVSINPDKKASIYGLRLGVQYILVETVAPAGHSLLATPICIELKRDESGQTQAALCNSQDNGQSGVFFPKNLLLAENHQKYLDENTALISVVDPRKGSLPKTGGAGVVQLALLGIATIGSAAWLLHRSSSGRELLR